MKIHTTNYRDAFITVAEDCPVNEGTVPPRKEGARTVANIQFDLLHGHPYQFTSDEALFKVHAERQGIGKEALEEARKQFFSKGQPCFRASPLTKRYGWGVHSDEKGKIALFGCQTAEYRRLASDPDLKVVPAMRSKR